MSAGEERGRSGGRVTRGKVASASFKSFFGHASSPPRQAKRQEKDKKKKTPPRLPSHWSRIDGCETGKTSQNTNRRACLAPPMAHGRGTTTEAAAFSRGFCSSSASCFVSSGNPRCVLRPRALRCRAGGGQSARVLRAMLHVVGVQVMCVCARAGGGWW